MPIGEEQSVARVTIIPLEIAVRSTGPSPPIRRRRRAANRSAHGSTLNLGDIRYGPDQENRKSVAGS